LTEAVAFSPDGRTVAAISSVFVRRGAHEPPQCAIHLWELASGKTILRISGGEDQLQAVAFSPNGRAFAAAGKGVIQLWDIATGKELLAYRGHEAQVLRLGALAFSRDGSRVAAGYLDSTAMVWDLTPGIRRAETLRSAVGRVALAQLWTNLLDD